MTEPIRILQVVTHMNRGGLETMLMNYYRHMDRSRVQFDFLVHREQRAAYDDEIESLGGVIYRLPRLVPWSLSYKKALNAFFEEHKEYKIVHVHQDCLSSVILKAAQKHGVPVRIAHSHNSNQDRNFKYMIKMICKRSIPKYATDLFACGKQAGEWMFGGAPFQILNNAIHSEAYQYDADKRTQMRIRLDIPDHAMVLGHVGRFSYPKNHDFLVDVFAALHKRGADAYLLLVGDGELRPQIEEKVDSLGLSDRVIFTGVRGDVPELLQAMDVLLFPSLYEGLPVTLVEAQTNGLPCVISDKIPLECKLTQDLVTVKCLNDPPEVWADHVLQQAKRERRDYSDEIMQNGYDIKQTAQWLGEFYLGIQSTRN